MLELGAKSPTALCADITSRTAGKKRGFCPLLSTLGVRPLVSFGQPLPAHTSPLLRPGSRAGRILGGIRLQGIVVAILAFEYVTIDWCEHLVQEAVHGFANEIAQVRPLPGDDV